MSQILSPFVSIQMQENILMYINEPSLFVQNTKTDEQIKTDNPETKPSAKACN